MADYGQDIRLGVFITPTNASPRHPVGLAVAAEEAGIDLVTFQDHPYQPRYLDTWTLLSFVAARTSTVTLAGNVLNLPLRQPAVLARSVASLDLLSGGRVELGLGTGAFWDAIEAMGGERLTPGRAVDALEQAIDVVRALWDTEASGGATAGGDLHHVKGAKRGPAPAHDVGVWLGAYKPRMLALTGRVADGWLPSVGYLSGGLDDLGPMSRRVDDAAHEAGRDPADVRRLLNVSGRFAADGSGFLEGPPRVWAEQLADLALLHGTSTFVLAADDETTIRTWAHEVGPALKELVAAER